MLSLDGVGGVMLQIWPERPFLLLSHWDRIGKRQLQTFLLPASGQYE